MTSAKNPTGFSGGSVNKSAIKWIIIFFAAMPLFWIRNIIIILAGIILMALSMVKFIAIAPDEDYKHRREY
jgi:membrane protein YdbS with pleckstrin-like domain